MESTAEKSEILSPLDPSNIVVTINIEGDKIPLKRG